MTSFIKRDYNSFTVERNGFVVCKTSEKERLKNEINYYHEIEKTDCGVFFARRIADNFIDGKYNLFIENYPLYDLSDTKNTRISVKTCEQIKFILQSFAEHKKPGNPDYKRQMYIDKTITEYNSLLEQNEYFRELAKHKFLNINRENFLNFDVIKDKIFQLVETHLINNDEFTIIHGDLCFSNILYGKRGDQTVIKLIDPRGSFGEVGIYGDPLYDLAKLSHSYNGRYEEIVRDQFKLKEDGNNFIFKPKRRRKNLELIFEKSYSRNLKNKIKLIEGLIYIGMCARHYDSLERQKAMYLTGIKILNRVSIWH